MKRGLILERMHLINEFDYTFLLFVRFFYWRTWWRSIADYRADDWLGSSGAIDRESGLVTLLIYPMRINDNMIVFMPKYHSAY